MKKILPGLIVIGLLMFSACKKEAPEICGTCAQTTVVKIEGWLDTYVTSTVEFCGEEYTTKLADPDSVYVNVAGLVITEVTYICP